MVRTADFIPTNPGAWGSSPHISPPPVPALSRGGWARAWLFPRPVSPKRRERGDGGRGGSAAGAALRYAAWLESDYSTAQHALFSARGGSQRGNELLSRDTG